MMKKIIFTMLMTVAFAFSVQAAEFKIGYVDMNKALNESDKGKKAVALLEEMVKSRQTEINKKGDELKTLDEEIAKQSSILNPDAIKEKREQRETLMRDYQRMIKDSQSEVQKKQSDFMGSIIDELRQVVAQMGKDAGYTLIFEKAQSGILFIVPETDITDQLIKQFNSIK
jgi:outer membrane protein